MKKYFAFDNPIEKFFRLSKQGYLYWKETNSRYLGANDAFANFIGIKTQNMMGISDHDFTTDTFLANKFQMNDKEVIRRDFTRGFFEYGEYISQNTLLCLSLKTPLKDSAGSICGVFGISFNLMEYNFKEVKNILKEFSSVPLDPSALFLSSATNTIKKALSKREQELVLLLIRGMTTKEAAANMGISPRTAEGHLNNIKIKLDCHSKSKLIQKLVVDHI